MSENLPAVIRDQAIMPQTFEGMMKQAEVLVKSGLLPASIKTPEAALAVMLAGREMGIPPMQAFRSLYVVNGQVTMAAQHMAAKLISAGVTYEVKRMTADVCEIAFSRGNGMRLTYTYTIQDAAAAQLTGKDNWKKFPKDMLYNRCMALGARKIAPDVLAGMYTPDEVGGIEVVNPETGEVIDVVARRAEEHSAEDINPSEQVPVESEPEPARTLPPRPYPAETIRKALQRAAAKGYGGLSTEAQQKYVVAALDALFANDESKVRTQKRHSLLLYVFGTDSSKNLTGGQASTLIEWASVKEDADGQIYYNPSEFAPAEAAAMVAAYEREQGQQELPL